MTGFHPVGYTPTTLTEVTNDLAPRTPGTAKLCIQHIELFVFLMPFLQVLLIVYMEYCNLLTADLQDNIIHYDLSR